MKVKEIIAELEKDYPPQMAMAWDNPGLQVGRMDRSVKKIYVALDATEDTIRECISWGADLLVTHHPLLMSGIKKVNSEDYLGRRVLMMAENGIAHYAMHTNYDTAKMSELAWKALKLEETQILEVTGADEEGRAYGIGSVGSLPERMAARECCGYVKKAFDLSNVRLFGNPETEICRLAVSPGSGKSMIGPALAARADILVTGDIGHHDGLDAVDQGLLIIDAGHYGIEHIFIRQMAEHLKKLFPELEIREAKAADPFAVF